MSKAPGDGCQPVSRNTRGEKERLPALVMRGHDLGRAHERASPTNMVAALDLICPVHPH
jgi:hypothetical protein